MSDDIPPTPEEIEAAKAVLDAEEVTEDEVIEEEPVEMIVEEDNTKVFITEEGTEALAESEDSDLPYVPTKWEKNMIRDGKLKMEDFPPEPIQEAPPEKSP